jgi:hypothetical protein
MELRRGHRLMLALIRAGFFCQRRLKVMVPHERNRQIKDRCDVRFSVVIDRKGRANASRRPEKLRLHGLLRFWQLFACRIYKNLLPRNIPPAPAIRSSYVSRPQFQKWQMPHSSVAGAAFVESETSTHPLCPKCAKAMEFSAVAIHDDDHDVRTFECRSCQCTERVIVAAPLT